jgi:hypothetical protein
MADLAHARENDTDLHGDTDAMHWAERFVHHVQQNPGIAADEGAMASWFAGAIETGRGSGVQPGVRVSFYFDDADPVARCECGWHAHGDAAVDAFRAWWAHLRDNPAHVAAM